MRALGPPRLPVQARPPAVMAGGDGRIRVVHVLLTADVGGLERVAIDLARKSDRERFDCRIVCARSAGALAPLAQKLGVQLDALGARGWVDGVLRLARRLRQIRPHVVHTHNPGAHRVGAPARLLARTPVLVHTKHGRNNPDDGGAVALNRRLARFSDAIVAVSADSAQVAREIERIPACKVHVIHNGVDPGAPPVDSAWDPWLPAAVTVARLDPIKDQKTLLQALARVVEVRGGFHLRVVGDGPERANLERLAADLGLGGNVTFLGHRDDVTSVLRGPQIFALSSISEGIPLTLLEAMAAGLPAVVTDVGGNREVVEPSVTGYLVAPQAPDALAAKIVALATDSNLARAFGLAGHSRVERLFNLKMTVRRYSDLYGQLLDLRQTDGRRR